MSTLLKEPLITPPVTPAESKLAREGSRLLAACISRGSTAHLRASDDGDEIEVPMAALQMLVDILNNMAAGNAVRLVPIHAELTTQQVADFLNVSRPYVVRLLERGDLPHHMVGTHRRVHFRDLVAYKNARLVKSRATLTELAREAQEQGFY